MNTQVSQKKMKLFQMSTIFKVKSHLDDISIYKQYTMIILGCLIFKICVQLVFK